MKLPTPLTFDLKQSETLVPFDKPITLTYTVRGGSGGLTYSLVAPPTGASIDAKTGKVTIDPEPLREPVNEALRQAIGGLPGNTAAERVDALKKLSDTRVRALTAKSATGVPVAIALRVVVTDTQNQSAILDHSLILDVDPAAAAALVDQSIDRRNQIR